MKILVLIGGQFNSIDENWWINLSEKTGLHFNFALSKWSNCELYLDEWIKSRIVWLDNEDPDVIGSVYKNLRLNEICNQDNAKPFNTLMMWHKWKRFANFQKIDDYDCIIKTRADIELDQQDIHNLVEAMHRVKNFPNSIAVPSGGDHGKSIKGHRQAINDVFALGSPKAIKKYLSIIDCWKKYAEETNLFHPETLLRFHLRDKSNMQILRFPALLRLRGAEYNHVTQRWYLDTLKFHSNFIERKYDRFKRSGHIF